MRTVLLVPWRTDDGVREKVWAACRRRWETLFPEWPIYEGASPDGPFNRSAAINDAAKQAGEWDVALVIDADVMLPAKNVREAVRRAAKTGQVTWPHRRWRGMSEEATTALLKAKPETAEGMLGPGGIERSDFTKADIDLLVEKTTRLSWSCAIAICRDAWDRIGGYDERFVGWGHEDGAFSSAVMGLVGHDRIEGDVLNWWHPRSPGLGMADRDQRGRWTPQALVNGRLGMRYMVALRRDYGLSDRPEPSSAEVIARDIRNLQKQDLQYARWQTLNEQRPFDDWWPPLDELIAGAKAHKAGPPPTITVIVHTGGSPETWPERREYLRRSLASLAENVTGGVIQRVVYSDWGPELQTELTAIVTPHGFYVAGDGHHGYTGSMQRMWKYLAKRAQGSYIFQTEDDFTYPKPVDLTPMVETLRANQHLVQIALLRDAFYQDERETGGVLGWPEPAFTRVGGNGTARLEHRLFWTANPNVFRKSLTATPWPEGHHSETLFGKLLLRDERTRFAFWGDHEELTRHIGQVRAGTGY